MGHPFKRSAGKSRDAVDGQGKHLPERIVRLAVFPFVSVELHPCLAESHPGDLSPQELALLGHLSQALHDLPVDQPEVARIQRHIDRRDLAHRPVETFGRRFLEPRFAFAMLPLCIDHFVTLTVFRIQFRYQFRRILQVAVDDHRSLSPHMV